MKLLFNLLTGKNDQSNAINNGNTDEHVESVTNGTHEIWADSLPPPNENGQEKIIFKEFKGRLDQALHDSHTCENQLVKYLKTKEADYKYKNNLAEYIFNFLEKKNKWNVLFTLMNPITDDGKSLILRHINFVHIGLMAITRKNLDALFCWLVAFAKWIGNGNNLPEVIVKGLENCIYYHMVSHFFNYDKKKEIATILVNYPYKLDVTTVIKPLGLFTPEELNKFAE